MNAEGSDGKTAASQLNHDVDWSDIIVALQITKPPIELVESDIVGKQLPSLKHWHSFYYAYARLTGFGVRSDKLRKDQDGVEWQRIWVCSREGFRKQRGENSITTQQKRAERAITRIGCNAKLKVTLDRLTLQWVATGFIHDHNHDLASESELQFLRCFRGVPDVMVAQAKTMRKVGIRTMSILDYMAQQCGGRDRLPFLKKDFYNKLAAERYTIGTETDSEGALGYLTALAIRDGNFYCRFNVDDEDRLHTLFWADGISRNDYNVFGEVLAFDTTYRRNAYNKPLLIFVGVNHHFRTTIFGVALLSDETTSTFNWVLQQFKDCMGGNAPKVVVTDGDLGMRAAINEIFPNAIHRLCAWHLGNNAASNVPIGEFKIQFSKLIYRYFSEAEFEDRWKQLIIEHNLEENGWASTVYASKRSWAETFLRGRFFGGMRTTQRCESMNSYMGRFLESKHLLRDFVSHIDQGIQNIRYTELQDDFTSKHTTPPIPSNHPLKCFFEQFAMVYTRNIYNAVVKEIEGQNSYSVTSSNYTPQCTTFNLTRFRFGEIQHVVRYFPTTNSINCTCLLFETDGIPCRHLFTVMKHLNIDQVPLSLFKDCWRKDAKISLHTQRPSCASSQDAFEVTRFGTLASDFNTLGLYASKFEDTFCKAREEIQNLTQNFKQIFITRQNNAPSSTTTFNENLAASNNIVRDPMRAKTKGREKDSKKLRHQMESTSSKPHRKRCRICNELGHNRATCKFQNNAMTQLNSTKPSTEHHDQTVRPTQTHSTTDANANRPNDQTFFPIHTDDYHCMYTSKMGETSTPAQNTHWDFGATTSCNPLNKYIS